LTNEERRALIAQVLEEVDQDRDGFICKPEFNYAIAKCPDFYHSFKLFI